MINKLKKPTYEELIALSNEALAEHIQLAIQQLDEEAEAGQCSLKNRQIYMAYHHERLQRLGIVKTKFPFAEGSPLLGEITVDEFVQ